MKEIPIRKFPRQSLSVVLENALYELSIKECNGVMAVSVARDGIVIVSNRRAVAGTPVIPPGYLEQGNFIFLTMNDGLPYYSRFEEGEKLVYVTAEKLEAIREGNNV